MQSILFDLDGVFYQGEQCIPGATDVAQWLQQMQIPHLFLTNTTSRPRSHIVEKLQGFNIPVDASRILTPAVAAKQWLKQESLMRPALFVPDATRTEFSEFEPVTGTLQTVDAVVVGDLGEAWDFQQLNQAFRYLMQDKTPRLLALGMTRYWRAEDGLRLDAGPFVTALSMASGVDPIVLGKPAVDFYQMALDTLHTPATQCIMLGDDIRGDTQGAMNAGIKGIQVKTGKFKPSDLNQGITPDAILDSIADLPEWWENQVARV